MGTLIYKKNKRVSFPLTISIILLFSFGFPFYFITDMYGWWQKEFVARDYAVGIEIQQKLYQIKGYNFAFTKSYFQPQEVYVDARNLDIYVILIALTQDYSHLSRQIQTKSDNPYFDGDLNTLELLSNKDKFINIKQQYINAGERYFIISLKSMDGEKFMGYSPDDNAPETLRYNPYLQRVVNQGMCRFEPGNKGCSAAEDTYLNISQIMSKYFHRKLTYYIDEDRKRIILQIENDTK